MYASDLEHRQFVVQRLLDTAARSGRIPGEQRRWAARTLQVSERTIARWVAAGNPPPRRAGESYQLSEEEKVLYFELAGNVAGVRQRLLAEGHQVPSHTTLWRAFRRELTAGQRKYAYAGEQGLRSERLTLQVDVRHRNEVWEADHKELAVEVIPRSGSRPVRPWVTIFIDAATRAVMGWSINVRPTAADVIAAFHSALVIDPDRGPFGGVPSLVRWDGGLEFLSDAVTEVVQTVGAMAKPTPPYSPHLKGKVERLNRTMEQQFLPGLPGWANGPRAANGSLYGPSGRMSMESLVARFDEWVQTYNLDHPHESLDGLSPLQAWEADDVPLRRIEPAEIPCCCPAPQCE